MKKILILAGSPHPDGNSGSLAAALAEGVRQGGSTVEIIQLAKQKVNFCQGCDYCRSHGGECIQQDDMAAILTRVEAADVIVLATPLYFLNFSAQLKGLHRPLLQPPSHRHADRQGRRAARHVGRSQQGWCGDVFSLATRPCLNCCTGKIKALSGSAVTGTMARSAPAPPWMRLRPWA